MLGFFCSIAQHNYAPFTEPDYNKPKLFADLPARFNLNLSALQDLFQAAVGEKIIIPLGAYSGPGIVVSKSDPADVMVKSVVIKSINRPGAIFTFTQLTDGNGTVSFKGRMLSRNHSDALELQQQNGQYILLKKPQLQIMSE
jgi:hypothetical protein